MFSVTNKSTIHWPGTILNVGVLVTALISGLILASICFCIGKHWESKHLFLRNYRPPSDYEAHIEFVMRYTLQSSEQNDVIFLGDSTCLTGLEPLKFKRLTGLKAYNLGSVGVLGIDGFVTVFQDYLKHHPKPRVLVFCVHPDTLQMPVSSLGPQEVQEQFLWAYGAESAKAKFFSEKPLVYYVRQGAQIIIGHIAGGPDHYLNEPIPNRKGMTFNSLWQQVANQRGYWAHPGVLPENFRRPVDPSGPLRLVPDYKQGLDSLARITSENGIILFIQLSPRVTTGSAEDYSGLNSDLENLAAQYQNVSVSQPVVLVHNPSSFGELRHLNRKGADAFTSLVADEVSKIIAKPKSNENLIPEYSGHPDAKAR